MDIKNLKGYKIPYRSKLGLKKSSSFGLEIEFSCRGNPDYLYEELLDFFPVALNQPCITNIGEWSLKQETTVENGLELTTPVFHDTERSWSCLKTACNILKENNAKINTHTGGHIHFGTQVLGENPENWLHFLELYALFEPILIRFAAGEFTSIRSSLNVFAPPMQSKIINNLKFTGFERQDSIYKTVRIFQGTRKGAINLSNVFDGKFRSKNTIEFRFPTSSLNPVIWQNNVLAIGRLLEYANSKTYDKEVIEYFLKDKNPAELYEKDPNVLLNLFTDKVLKSDDERLSFLRQYVKDDYFWDKASPKMKKAHVFTKNP